MKTEIPSHTEEALRLYVDKGLPTGGFLYAVLTNDLFGAYSRADSENLAAMEAIVRYVYNKLPIGAWGSPENVKNWLDIAREKRGAQ